MLSYIYNIKVSTNRDEQKLSQLFQSQGSLMILSLDASLDIVTGILKVSIPVLISLLMF